MRIASHGRLLSVAFATLLAHTGVAMAGDPAVAGTFKGNGQDAKLAYVSAQKGEPFADKPTIVLVFTELDHSKDKQAAIKAGFGDYGSALIITVQESGKIIGCEVAHKSHAMSGFSAVGSIAMSNFKLADGKISGKIKTDGVVDTFKQKWEVDIAFEVQAP
jgi:hypothetical protein